jgi:hypothetical protein
MPSRPNTQSQDFSMSDRNYNSNTSVSSGRRGNSAVADHMQYK